MNWTGGGIVTGYGYDLVGNRQYASRGAANDFYSYDPLNGPDRLKAVERFTMGSMQRTEYLHDADGAVVRRQTFDSIFTPPMVTPNPPETFAYSFRSLLWKYTFNGANNDWRYRYSASGEREQKRKYPLDINIHQTADRNPWVYYLLGGGKEQLAVWHGQEIWTNTGCQNLPIGEVAMYPVEYNSYVGGLARVSTNVTQAPEGLKLFHIADHLGSVRVSLDSIGRLTQLDYEPFGAVASMAQLGADVPRQTFIDKEKDGENGLGDFGVRKYEEETGRFLSKEPLWEKYRATSPFSYSLDNPIQLTDPSGLNPGIPLIQQAVIPELGGGFGDEQVGGGGAALLIPAVVAIAEQLQKLAQALAEGSDETPELTSQQQEKLRSKSQDKKDVRPGPGQGQMGGNRKENREAKEIARRLGITGKKALRKLHEELHKLHDYLGPDVKMGEIEKWMRDHGLGKK